MHTNSNKLLIEAIWAPNQDIIWIQRLIQVAFGITFLIIAAKVNDHIISAKDVLIALEKLPEKIKEQPLPSIYPKLINELINQHLIAQQAYKEKLDQNKKVLSEINKSKEQIMAKFWLKNFLDKQTKKKNVESFYKNYLKTFKVSKEFNASHILVKEKKTASEIIKKLNNDIV